MKQIIAEPKMQRWCLFGILDTKEEVLIYMGSNIAQVKGNYITVWDDEYLQFIRHRVRKLILSRWRGTVDAGNWISVAELPIPYDLDR